MTTIEWTHVPDPSGGRKRGETWNPQVGCREVSPGCRNCYAAKLAHRRLSKQHEGLTVVGESSGVHWNGRVNRVPRLLEKPLRWREPRGVFVGSMTDLFYEVGTEEDRRWIAAIFGVMAAAPQHTFLLLTKRPAKMREWFGWLADAAKDECEVQDVCMRAVARHSPDAAQRMRAQQGGAFDRWPLPNVWIGTTTEDQRRADERIPELLRVPAAKRFLSVEPMLGPVDLGAWIKPVAPIPASEAPDSWDKFPWPPWVPAEVRESIANFWGPPSGRKPKHYLDDCVLQGSPPFGERFAYDGSGGRVVGRWIHCWNNIGRIIDDEGVAHLASTPRGDLLDMKRRSWQPIDWVICGGESGSGSRAMSLDWPRSLRDQCVASGVPFFFKQWGEWAPPSQVPESTWTDLDAAEDPPDMHSDKPIRVGKKRAGRELDGRIWDEFPASLHGADRE